MSGEQIKPGYKRTEVGVIPADWEAVRLGIFSEITKLAGFEYTNHFNSYKDRGDVIVVRGTNIAHNRLDLTDLKTIPRSTSEKLPRSKLNKGDLVFAYVGTIGPIFLIDENDRYHLGPNTAKITCNKDIDPKFLFCYFASNLIHKEINERISTGAQPSLSMAKIRDFRIIKPTKAEQQAIASALSDVDTLLVKLDQLIAKKRDLKQATMQQLLTGQTRLPGFSGEWAVKRLGEISDCLDNLRVPLNESERNKMRGDYPYCGANGVLDYVSGYTIDDDIVLIAEDGGYFDEYSYRPIAYRMNGKCWVNNHAHILKSKAGHDQSYLFFSLVHKNILSFLASGTRAKLNKSEMWKIEIFTPLEQVEQTAIATALSDMDVELAALEARRDKTRTLKQGMMQELLTGRVRLVESI